MRLKVSEASWHAFSSSLLARHDVESAGVLLARVYDANENDPLLVAVDMQVMPDEAYLIRPFDRLRLDAIVLNRMTQRARDEGLSIFTVHTHPMASDAWFSWADDAGDAKLMPSLHAQAHGVPHGSIVVSASGATLARVFDDNGKSSNIDFDVVGRQLRRHPAASLEMLQDGRFARQELALGPSGQQRLRNMRVGVIGLGGVGSLVSLQLAHLGVGKLVLIDGNLVSESNLSRIVGARRDDINITTKVDVAAQYAHSSGLPSNVSTVASYFSEEHVRIARGCDVLFSCVDRHTPRALLNRIAYEAMIPVIDMGSAFRVAPETGVLTSCGGRVVIVGPGRPCMHCWGQICPDALREEAMTEGELRLLERQGYLRGAAVAQPSVIAFNANIAGAAVIEFLRLITGFAGTDEPPNRLSFEFETGVVGRNTVERRNGCTCEIIPNS
jgi:molybdopterin/thiamine biosynthesis adenylyltransferase